jgi:hypothetical protein
MRLIAGLVALHVYAATPAIPLNACPNSPATFTVDSYAGISSPGHFQVCACCTLAAHAQLYRT